MSKQDTKHDAKQTNADVVAPNEQQAQSRQKNTKKKSRWPLFALAFILGNAAAFFAFKLNLEHNFFNIPSSKQTKTIEPAPVKTMVQPTILTPMSSEEGVTLIAAMNKLQEQIQSLKEELQILRDKQAQANQAQSNIEAMQLHARLTSITNPSSHLSQITLAWQEVALLPSLDADQRLKAESMFTLSQQRLNQVSQWKQELKHISHMLKPSEYNNMIPESLSKDETNPWLAWLSKQFSLKHSQNKQEMDIAELRQRLNRIEHNMDIEQWPTGASWTQLRAQLQLYLVNASDKENPVLQLPESFRAIQDDIQELRITAHDWLEEL